MKKEIFVARNVDRDVYKKFRQKALERGLSVGNAISMAMELWVASDSNKGKDFSKLMEVAGLIKTKGKVKWSEEVDEILYGSENDIPRH
jgi:hypothetical protein